MSRLSILLAVVLVAGLLAPAGAAEDGDVRTVAGQSEPVYTESVTEVLRVETTWGTLYGEVVRPVVPDGVDVPVILTYSPYNHLSGADIANDATARYFVPRGYARAKFDVVGTKDSTGCFDYGGVRERETGAELVDALGTADWSNGKVAMIGGSYDGTTAIAAAVEAPEHLAAIVPQVAIDRWYDYAFGGGVRYFLNSERPTDEGFDTPLAFDFGFAVLPPMTADDPAATARAAQARITPCDELLHTQRAYLPDPVYDSFWDERDYRARAGAVEAAVLLEGGWLDHNVKHWDSTRFFAALPPDTPKHLVMGQWAHTSSRHADAQDLRHAWFDRYLLGLDTGVEDLPSFDTQTNTGERVQEATYPVPGTRDVTMLLTPDPVGADALALEQDVPTWSDTNAALTEEQMLAGVDPVGQTFVSFLSEPLDEAVRITGGPELDLRATSSAPETHFLPTLFDEAPDGTRTVITRGFLNSRNRDGLDTSTPVVPGRAYRAPVELWDVDWELGAGHRLGVTVSSANAAWALPDDGVPATTTLDLDDEGASTLRLPVTRGAAALGFTEPAPEKAAPRPGKGGRLRWAS